MTQVQGRLSYFFIHFLWCWFVIFFQNKKLETCFVHPKHSLISASFIPMPIQVFNLPTTSTSEFLPLVCNPLQSHVRIDQESKGVYHCLEQELWPNRKVTNYQLCFGKGAGRVGVCRSRAWIPPVGRPAQKTPPATKGALDDLWWDEGLRVEDYRRFVLSGWHILVVYR